MLTILLYVWKSEYCKSIDAWIYWLKKLILSASGDLVIMFIENQ